LHHKGYQWGNHRMGHCQTHVNSASPRMLEVAVAKIQRQPTRLKVTQSPTVVITIIGVETCVAHDEMLHNYYSNSCSRISK
jgi:hypothetical protein